DGHPARRVLRLGGARERQAVVPVTAPIPDRNRVNLSWLVQLRWAQLGGQAATVAAVALLGVSIPVVALAAVVLTGVVSNVFLELRLRDPPPVAEWQVAATMALDVAVLTALLHLTAGPVHPFCFL